jgi:FkbM family methyltransferase
MADPRLSASLAAYLDGRPPVVLVDVGAYRGGFYRAVAGRCGVARAVLVEAIPERAAQLRDRHAGPAVTVVDAAAADADGRRVPFSVNTYAETSSLLPLRGLMPELAGLDTRPERTVTVQTVTLDALYRDQGLARVDLLKIDVQGAEDRVLEGAQEALARTRLVWIETSFKPLYEGSALFGDVYARLSAAGFELREVSPGYRSPAGELLQADLLFARPGEPVRVPAASAVAPRWRRLAGALAGAVRRLRRPGAALPPGSAPSFSQSGEDRIVHYLFRLRSVARPRYLDVGAHHPWFLSNTALFYVEGARGINVDANRELIAAFERERPQDHNLACAVGGAAGTVDLHVFADAALSTASPAEAERLQRAGQQRLRVEAVPVRTLLDIVEREGGGAVPDLLNVDVEGLEQEILAPLAGQPCLPSVLVVETAGYAPDGAGPKRQDLVDFIAGLGYRLYADTQLNSIFVRPGFWRR